MARDYDTYEDGFYEKKGDVMHHVGEKMISLSELRMNLSEMVQQIHQDLDKDSALAGQMIGFNDALDQVCERLTGSPLSE